MSRLDEECIMAVVRNRSGIDSGEIDYHINVLRFENMSQHDLKETLKTIKVLVEKVDSRIEELDKEV